MTEQGLVSNDEDRVAVLLGAGASVDAGLMVTSNLAAAVVEEANNIEPYPGAAKQDWVRALNAVYAGMIGHVGATGGNPLSAVNIETLISALRLLRSRDKHEVAPFVASWSPGVSDFGYSQLPTSAGRQILDSVKEALMRGRKFEARPIAEAVAEIAVAALRPDFERPFAKAEDFVLETLSRLLGEHGDTSYLNPLIELARNQQGGLDVITLNYDLTVESAAAAHGVTVNRGIENWEPGHELEFPSLDGQLNLLKLHGSLDWEQTHSRSDKANYLEPRAIQIRQSDENSSPHHPPAHPWIVVGDREKLATEGPTLALNFAGKAALRRARHLSVIGYSFSDTHINSMIRDWLNADPRRTVSILDLNWPREKHAIGVTDFRSALLATFGRHQDELGKPRTPRVIPVEGTAKAKLQATLEARPIATEAEWASLSVTAATDSNTLAVTWLGLEITDPDLTIKNVDGEAHMLLNHSAVPVRGYEDDPSMIDGPRGGVWSTGETRVFRLDPSIGTSFRLSIRGSSILGEQSWSGSTPLATDHEDTAIHNRDLIQ